MNSVINTITMYVEYNLHMKTIHIYYIFLFKGSTLYKTCEYTGGVCMYVSKVISAYLNSRHIRWLIVYNTYP